MAQVSESSASPQDAFGPLRTRNSGQNQQPAVQEQKKQTQQVRPREDEVQISAEAKDQDRGGRVEDGKRNADNLRPQSEQIENERGAAQKLKDQAGNNARETREYESSTAQTGQEKATSNKVDLRETAGGSPAPSFEVQTGAETSEKQAADNSNSDVQLRKFQDKDEVRIEPKAVEKSVDEIKVQRERAEAAKEPALEAPSQKIIEEETGSNSARSADNNVRNDPQRSARQSANPVSVETETGQNVDDLI